MKEKYLYALITSGLLTFFMYLKLINCHIFNYLINWFTIAFLIILVDIFLFIKSDKKTKSAFVIFFNVIIIVLQIVFVNWIDNYCFLTIKNKSNCNIQNLSIKSIPPSRILVEKKVKVMEAGNNEFFMIDRFDNRSYLIEYDYKSTHVSKRFSYPNYFRLSIKYDTLTIGKDLKIIEWYRW
jgi:hypothetical protein